MKQKINPFQKLKMSLIFGVLLFCALAAPARSQPKPLAVLTEAELNDLALYDAWVEFIDKDIRTRKQRREILEHLRKTFNPKALSRRIAKRTLQGLFDEKDFPLAQKYLKGVADTGAQIRVKSRWLNGVTILASKKQIMTVKKLPFVTSVKDFHEHKPRQKLETPLKQRPQRPVEISGFYGRSEVQIQQLGLDKLHKAGYTGKGTVIAVVDCGFDLSHSALEHLTDSNRLIAQWDFVENDPDVIPQAEMHPTNYDHGTTVLGAIASYKPEELIGTAYDADFILCNAEDGEIEYYLEERWFVAALEFAEFHGADVITSSLVLYDGYSTDQADGKTAVMTQGLNTAVANGVICLTGGGNFGNDQDLSISHLFPPADAVEVISVGAVDPEGNIARFSSDGPTKDGRLKPEVLAQGTRVSTIAIADKNGYSQASGTSIATPLMAGAVACLLQVHPEWTVQSLRKALFESGKYYRQHGKPDPLFVRGYGIPDVYLAAGMPGKK
jgi:subtilisin family serine protease